MQEYIDDKFALIAVLTFYVTEAIIYATPGTGRKFKRIVAISVGCAAGLMIEPSVQGAIRGILAGGATTVAVAKLKN